MSAPVALRLQMWTTMPSSDVGAGSQAYAVGTFLTKLSLEPPEVV